MNAPIELNTGDRILISRTDRLGDLILAIPFVETLKLRYPECQVDVCASLYASPILENNPRIDKIVRVQNDQLFSSRAYKKNLRHNIKQSGYKIVVALYPERQVCRLFNQAGIPHRVGTAGRFHSVFFNHRLLHSRKGNRKHEFEYNLDFLKFFKDGETIRNAQVYPTDREIRNANRILGEAGVSAQFALLHPGSGGSAERWPLERFIQLYAELKGAGLSVVISGSEEEGKRISDVARRQGVVVRSIAGDTDLRTLAAVLSQASTVVANSTGPLHLAAAVGTRVIGLYPGKKVMSPKRWGPLGNGHVMILPDDLRCPCPKNNCHCMENIRVEKVAKYVVDMLGQSVLIR